MIRFYLYVLAGVTAAFTGWSLGQFILSDLTKIFPSWIVLKQYPEAVLFPAVAMMLSIGIVANEILVSSPTRLRLNWRIPHGIAWQPISIAAILGLLIGGLAGGLAQILFSPYFDTPESTVRIIGWLCIGGAVGFAEGYTWRWRSIEAGDPKRFYTRLAVSVICGSLSSLLAALIFEAFFDKFPANWVDPLGFCLMGFIEGSVFSFTTSPSYMAALRAGAGFEYTNILPTATLNPNAGNYNQAMGNKLPRINNSKLSFVSKGHSKTKKPQRIEEGLSIRLPERGELTIGGDSSCDIHLPGIPDFVAILELSPRSVELIPDEDNYDQIACKERKLNSSNSLVLKHSHTISFYITDPDFYVEDPNRTNGEKYYRFVLYNRFLDPRG
jgi:hypothetical protein